MRILVLLLVLCFVASPATGQSDFPCDIYIDIDCSGSQLYCKSWAWMYCASTIAPRTEPGRRRAPDLRRQRVGLHSVCGVTCDMLDGCEIVIPASRGTGPSIETKWIVATAVGSALPDCCCRFSSLVSPRLWAENAEWCLRFYC
jgi:hypothetical protein